MLDTIITIISVIGVVISVATSVTTIISTRKKSIDDFNKAKNKKMEK
jgi:hypothetical protein